MKVLRGAAPTKTNKMVKTNIIPERVYEVQVGGLDKLELLRLQRMVAAHLPPFGGGKSRRRTRDPTAAAATAA